MPGTNNLCTWGRWSGKKRSDQPWTWSSVWVSKPCWNRGALIAQPLLCSGLHEASSNPVWTFWLVLSGNRELLTCFPEFNQHTLHLPKNPGMPLERYQSFQEIRWQRLNQWWLLALFFLHRWLMEWSFAPGQRCNYSVHLTQYLEILFGYTVLKRKNLSATGLPIPSGKWMLSGSWSPWSSELPFRDEVFKEYWWLAYAKWVAKNLPGVLLVVFYPIHLGVHSSPRHHL